MPGTFVFRPIEANLTHDTDWRGKMDPYCAYMINNKRIKGQVCKSGGQHPIWSESTTVPMEVDQPACVVELMDKDMLIDDSIGTFVIDLTEVQNYGTVSKWYPVFHKNKPAGQILFEAAYQPAAQNVHVIQPVIKETVLVEEVPKRAMVEETIIQKEVPTTMTTETFGQSSFISKGGVIPVGSTNLDGGLYGKVVHMEPVSHVRDAHLGAGGLHQDQLPRTQLGGPLSGSLGGGVLGSRELGAGELIGGATTHNVTSYTETQYHTSQLPTSNFQGSNLQGSNFQGSQFGNQPLNQNLGNQYAGSNLPTNFNTTSVSNAQLGGGAPLYKETANHPTANAGNISGQGNLGQGNLGQGNLGQGNFGQGNLGQGNLGQGNIVPGDLVGGHNQTNQNIGDRNPL